VAWSLPGFCALGVFALMAALQSAHLDPSDAWMLVTIPIGLIGVASWGFGPFCTLVALWLLFRDPWRRERALGANSPEAARLGIPGRVVR